MNLPKNGLVYNKSKKSYNRRTKNSRTIKSNKSQIKKHLKIRLSVN